MLSATSPTSATIARIAAAANTLARGRQHEQRREAAEDEKGRGERSSRVRSERETDEERRSEHHDSECHGARVGPGPDGPDRPTDRKAQESVATSRSSFGDASSQVDPCHARGRCRGPCRLRGVHAAGACGRAPLHTLQRVGLRRLDGARLRHRRIARLSRREGAGGLGRDHARARMLDLRRDLVRGLQARDVPVDGRRRVHRLLRVPLRRHGPAAPLARTLDRRHALARRCHCGPRCRSGRRRSARRARPGGHAGIDLDGRHEPRVPTRRHSPPLPRVRGLLADELAARQTLAPPRPRGALDDAGGCHLPLPVLRGHVRRGDVDRHPLADRDAARRVVRLDARPDEGRPRGRGPAAAGGAGRLRVRRDGNPLLRPLHPRRTCSLSRSPRRRSCSSSSGSRPRSGRISACSS